MKSLPVFVVVSFVAGEKSIAVFCSRMDFEVSNVANSGALVSYRGFLF